MISDRAGFTLVEVLMTIVLVGILSAVGIVSYVDFSTDAKKAVTQTRLTDLRTAIVGDPHLVSNGQYVNPGFIAQVGSVPNSLNDLVNQGSYPNYDPISQSGWRGPYVDSTLSTWDLDGWNHVIQYDKTARTLTSCGPDGTCGNGDDIVVQF